MAYGRRTIGSSLSQLFTLDPLPYPVLFVLTLMFVFLGPSWYLSYESVVESMEEQLGWVRLAAPLILLVLVRWFSSLESPESFFFARNTHGWFRTRRQQLPAEQGSSPWFVAALIVLVLVLMQYQSSFQERWFAGYFTN